MRRLLESVGLERRSKDVTDASADRILSYIDEDAVRIAIAKTLLRARASERSSSQFQIPRSPLSMPSVQRSASSCSRVRSMRSRPCLLSRSPPPARALVRSLGGYFRAHDHGGFGYPTRPVSSAAWERSAACYTSHRAVVERTSGRCLPYLRRWPNGSEGYRSGGVSTHTAKRGASQLENIDCRQCGSTTRGIVVSTLGWRLEVGDADQ
jgi:hypothetical protein